MLPFDEGPAAFSVCGSWCFDGLQGGDKGLRGRELGLGQDAAACLSHLVPLARPPVATLHAPTTQSKLTEVLRQKLEQYLTASEHIASAASRFVVNSRANPDWALCDQEVEPSYVFLVCEVCEYAAQPLGAVRTQLGLMNHLGLCRSRWDSVAPATPTTRVQTTT